MASTVASILGASVPRDQPLMEAGLDSLGAVDLRNALGQRFSLELPATATFDHPTVDAMAAYIGATLGPLQRQERQVAAPPWRGSAIAAAGADFGAPTSAAVQVVGLSCIYPGEAPAHQSDACHCSASAYIRDNLQAHAAVCCKHGGSQLSALIGTCLQMQKPHALAAQVRRAAPARRASGRRRWAVRTCRPRSPSTAGPWSACTRPTWP